MHVAVAVLFVISKFVLCLLSTHFVLCFFNVTNVVFTCPLSCSEDLEVIVIVCDSLVSSCGRVVTIIFVIVYDSLVRCCGRVVTIIIVIVYDSLVRHCGKVLANVIVIVIV